MVPGVHVLLDVQAVTVRGHYFLACAPNQVRVSCVRAV